MAGNTAFDQGFGQGFGMYNAITARKEKKRDEEKLRSAADFQEEFPQSEFGANAPTYEDYANTRGEAPAASLSEYTDIGRRRQANMNVLERAAMDLKKAKTEEAVSEGGRALTLAGEMYGRGNQTLKQKAVDHVTGFYNRFVNDGFQSQARVFQPGEKRPEGVDPDTEIGVAIRGKGPDGKDALDYMQFKNFKEYEDFARHYLAGYGWQKNMLDAEQTGRLARVTGAAERENEAQKRKEKENYARKLLGLAGITDVDLALAKMVTGYKPREEKFQTLKSGTDTVIGKIGEKGEFLETDRLKEPEEKGMIQLPGTDIKVSRKEAMSELKTLGGLLKAGGGQGVVGEDFKIQDAQAMVSDPGVLKQVQEMAKSEDPFQKRLADRFMTLASALYPESEQEQRARGEAPVGEGTGGADVPAPEGMPENLKTKVLEASKRGKAILLKDGRTLWFNGSEIVEQ